MKKYQENLLRLADERVMRLMRIITIEKDFDGQADRIMYEYIGEIKGIAAMCMYADVISGKDFITIVKTLNKL